MIQGTMKWTSPTREFGLLTPHDGSRDIFVRFASAIASTCTRMDGEDLPSTMSSHQHRRDHKVASTVEVRTRYERGQWAGGYEIAQVVELGYRIRRPGSLDTLPDIFEPADVRRAGD